MANIKFSQFVTVASLSATGQIVGFDGANNIRLTKAALEGSLNLGNLAGAVDAGTQVTGTLAVGNGGTGLSTYVQGDILYADSGGGLSRLAAGAANTILTANGATTDPSWNEPYTNTQIDYRSIRNDAWEDAAPFPYGNVSRGTEFMMGLTETTINYTTHPTSSGIVRSEITSATTPLPAGVAAFGTGGQYSIWTLSAGFYTVNVKTFFFDNTNNLDTQVYIHVGLTSINAFIDKYTIIKQSTVEAIDSRIFDGSLTIRVPAGQTRFIALGLKFDNGTSDPFPYNLPGTTDYPLQITINRI